MSDPHADCPPPVYRGSRYVCTAHHPPQPVNVTRAPAPKDVQAQLAAATPPQRRQGASVGMGATLGATVTALQARVTELEAQLATREASIAEWEAKVAELTTELGKARKGPAKTKGGKRGR